ncbi:MAG: tetratricopeptide repeat protein [Desulfocapsaceae bacterium]|nr:tetratricopeptide repeat protein [Desulfocapsaceae bacterium]
MEQTDFNSLKRKVAALTAQRHYEKAIGILESLVKKDPENPDIYLFLGDVSQNVNATDAIVYYKKGLDIQPKNPYLNTGLGFLYFSLKDFTNAERYLVALWVEDPTNCRLLTALGKIYKSWKQYEKAMKYFHICELLDPDNSFAVYGLADTYRGLGKHETALKYWLKFHSIEPNNKVAVTRIGDCYSTLNDKENALIFYRKALDIGYDFYASIGMAKIYLSKNNVEKAREIFEGISGSEQKNSRYFFEYIRFCLESGMKEKALELHGTATHLFPGNTYIESLDSKMPGAVSQRLPARN